MSRIYDNWERLVAAVLKKQQLWELFHEQSRSPSIRSETSDFSPRSSFTSSIHDVAVDLLSPGSSSRRPDAFAKLQPKLVFVSDFSPAFDVEDAFLASSELIWRGTFGSVYRVAMTNRVTIVAKRLKPGITSEVEFKRNMEIVGNVKNVNVVPLRAYYSSKDESVMLYDHYSKGSVFVLLHGRTGRNGAPVEWETRLRIAIGAARGTAEIHAQEGGKSVHGNIKASNVFINSQQYGCISDFGLANMMTEVFLPTALCYAPEVKSTYNTSQASDVYSFGVLLLELLTRKSPIDIPGGPWAVDLVQLVTSVKSKEWAAKVFDKDLLKYPEIKEEMVKLLLIGILCVAKSPKKRPKMAEVVKMLEKISTTSTRTQTPGSSEQKFVFFQDNNLFNLQDVLRASAEVLGKGTFGTSYKATLENGMTIVVKRLRDVGVTFKNIQPQMEVIGMMRHENVAELKAYYFSKDEKLLVYDYYKEGSLSALLQGMYGDKRASLDWDARVKIAVGVARGIAHIHRQDGQTFVHGNINPANIFLNGQQYGLVSNGGLAKFVSSIGLSAVPTTVYWAPEVTNIGRVSQASDVYSLGVVLLELVTGKPSQGPVVHEEWTAEVLGLKLLKDGYEAEAMERLLQIAMDCVTMAPERRPKMPEVVKRLEEISGVFTVDCVTTAPERRHKMPEAVKRLEEISGVFTADQPSVESRLEYLLEDLLPTLIP